MTPNPIFDLVKRRREGIPAGIPSYCTANEIVIEAVLEQGKRFGDKVLVEATSNQVNQFGGYTGMKPADYRDYVYRIADRIEHLKVETALNAIGVDRIENNFTGTESTNSCMWDSSITID